MISVTVIDRKNKTQYFLVAIVFVVMIMFSRGTLLGNLAMKVSFFAGVACFVYAIVTKNSFDKRSAYILLSCLVFFAYCFIQGIILNSESEYHFVVENTVYWILNTVVASLILSSIGIEKCFGKVMVLVLSLSVFSYCITMLLSFVVPLESLHYFTLDYGYFYDAPVYLPFTIAYGAGKVGSFDIVRMLGFGRECGISQTFYIWAFFKCEDYFKRYRLIRLIMGLGILCCFSTTGLIIFSVSFVAYLILNYKKGSKLAKYLILIAVIVLILLCSGTYSIANRMEKSYADRLDNMIQGVKLLLEYPIFGYGFMRPVAVDNDLSDICLLSSMGKIGIVGLILFLSIYVIAFVMSEDKKKFIICNCAFFVTTLLAQPLYAVPLIYVFLFADYSMSPQKNSDNTNALESNVE